jgi:hypothetical protein
MPEPLPRARLTPPAMRPDSAPPPGMHHPAFPPAPYPPPSRQRRWPTIVAIAVASAAVAATVTALITTQISHRAGSAPTHTAGATVTVTATPSAAPTPLPVAEADRNTCNAWLAAGKHVDVATHALSTLPKGMRIVDQPARDNPEWSAAARTAATEYGRAGDTLAAGIAPGTTTILSQAASTAADALHTLSTADSTLDAAGGNTFQVWKESADTVNVLCDRFAPQ